MKPSNRRNPRKHRNARKSKNDKTGRTGGMVRPAALASMLIACGVLALSAGCQSSRPAAGDSRPGAASDRSTQTAGMAVNTAVLAAVEKSHVIGPAAARELNYRVDWQYVGAGRELRQLTVQGDSVFTLDSQNFLTRIRVQDGGRLWQVQVAQPIEEILGITFSGGRVFVSTGSAALVLDAGNGSQVAKQPFETIANTAPVLFGQFLIYGSRNGQIVWHSSQIGYQWRSYQVAHSVQVPPVLSEGFVVAVGNDGTLMVLNASNVTQYWSRKLLDAIVPAPAVGLGAVFVAGLDQYLRAYDLGTGRNLWRVLTESPLTDPPVLLGERLYQQIPKQGLYCFKAVPEDSPGGELIWKAPAVKGNVILERRGELFVWDAAATALTVVDATRGSIIKTLTLPDAKHLIVAGANNDQLYAASNDGRVVRVVPRN